jgi:hypothetical protein
LMRGGRIKNPRMVYATRIAAIQIPIFLCFGDSGFIVVPSDILFGYVLTLIYWES